MKQQKEGANYCLDQRRGYEDIAEWVGFGIGMAGLIVAGFFTFGKTWVLAAAWAAVVIGTATELTSQFSEWEGSWPGEENPRLDNSYVSDKTGFKYAVIKENAK